MMGDNAGYITASGFGKAVFKVTRDDIPDIIDAVCTEYLIMKSISEINQFQEGLNVLGVSDLIKAHLGFSRKHLSTATKSSQHQTLMIFFSQCFLLQEAMLERRKKL